MIGFCMLRKLCSAEAARVCVILVGMLTVCAGSAAREPEHADGGDTPEMPNVVIIVADDLGYGDIGAYGASRIRTPHIDNLAQRGLRFTQGYASANVCSPSRAGLMTGRYAIRSGLAWKVIGAADRHGLPDAEETVGELALRRNYNTLFVGKWHLGNFPDYFPAYHGFDEFFGVPASNDMPNLALYENKRLIDAKVNQASLTRRYTERAERFIAGNAGGPFLLVLSHTFPHIPLFASDEFRGSSGAGLYGDTVEELDWSTGRIVTELERAGVLQNTLIIFTSDNGPFFEGSTAGLKGGKGTSWEGGYRVPLIAYWPAVIAPGRVTEAMTMNIDILPTIAQLLDLDPAAETIDGHSLVPIFAGTDDSRHEYLYYFNNERIVGVRSARWKYVTHAYYTGSLGAFEKFDQLPGFASAYELLLQAHGSEGEAYSYADRYPDDLRRHKRALASAREEFAHLRTRPLERTYPE